MPKDYMPDYYDPHTGVFSLDNLLFASGGSAAIYLKLKGFSGVEALEYLRLLIEETKASKR